MFPKRLCTSIVLALVLFPLLGQPASAITAELAKKCRLMAIKAHPTPMPGTKSTGVEKAQRDYFRECVAKNGKMMN